MNYNLSYFIQHLFLIQTDFIAQKREIKESIIKKDSTSNTTP